MKILQVITSLEFGGAEKLVAEISIALQQKGHEIALALFRRSDTALAQSIKQSGISVYEFSDDPYSLKNIRKLRQLSKQFDVVHTHNYSPQLFGAIASLGSNAKWVTTEHSPSNRRRSKAYFAPIDRWMYNRYDAVIGISQQSIDNLLAFTGPLKHRPELIANGIDVNKYHTAQEHPEFRTHEGRFVLVNVAGFRAEKDQDTLIRTMSLLPSDQFELWLVGDGVRRKELEALVRELGVESQVKFWGLRSDVPEILRSSDAVVMCSHYEGLSLSNIEGMSVGKPFIADDVTGLREMTQNVGLLFPYKDAAALAQLLKTLKTDTSLAQRIAEKCYQKAKEFDISRTVEAYLDLYQCLSRTDL